MSQKQIYMRPRISAVAQEIVLLRATKLISNHMTKD